MVDIVSLASSLLQASYGGVPFLYVDSTDDPGRHTLRFLFPGSDQPAYQDLGQDDGTIRLTGLLIGDDYVLQANNLRNAFQKPGPQTLVHPWLGSMLVVLSERPKFEDAQDKIRCTKFEASFWRFVRRVPEPLSTLDSLLNAADALKAKAQALLAQILAPAALAVAVATVSYVTGFCGQAAGWFTIVTNGGLQNIVANSLANLSPGPTAAGTAIDGRLTVAAMLAAAASAAAAMTHPTPGPELSVSLRATILADAAQTASDIAFTSAQEAMSWRDQVAAALDAAADDAATVASEALAPASPESLGTVWDALIALRACWMADMNTVIGGLPSVELLQLPAAAPAWLIAAYVAGDDPTQIVPALQDLVTRNNLRSLGLVTQAVLEVLG